MSDLNIVSLQGRLTKSAEVSYTNTNRAIVKFSIANNRSWKNQSGDYENRANFFDCVMFGKYGESMAKHLTKGRMFNFEGKLQQDRWEKDGMKYSKISIIVSEVSFVPTGKSDNASSDNASSDNGFTNIPQEQNFPAETYEANPYEETPEKIPF